MSLRLHLIIAVVFLVPMHTATTFAQTTSRTSLTDNTIRYRTTESHHVALNRNGFTAVIVDNHAVDTPDLPDHRAGYNGLASLSHDEQPKNLFVPFYAGLNFEHIHDGTSAGLNEKFEPRKFPMELRLIDDFTVELYQPPTGNWQLESCGRYRMLSDGAIEYTFECIPRKNSYANGFIGLFWASYIQQPEDKSIYFRGSVLGSDTVSWINAITPQHGVASTHRPHQAAKLPPIEDGFPLSLVNHPSNQVVVEPWYFGIRGGRAFVQMFRPQDNIWIAQSPSGGGNGNPAWDFQWFIRDPHVGQAYGFVMRASYVPFDSPDQIRDVTRKHRVALGHAN